MQNDQIYSEIINLVSTKDDLNLINNELDLLEEGIYETKGNTFDFVMENSISGSLSILVSKLILGQDKETIIKKLKEQMLEVKFVELTIAIDPSKKFIEKLANWLKESVDQKIAIDIKIDHSIIGGTKIIFEGKYFDGSIKNKLDKILINYA